VTQVANIRTGISVQKDLAEEADALARELRVTRSQLYSMALRDFIRRHESASMLERLDAAYGGGTDPEEERLLESAKRYSRRLLHEDER
jgi:metal-responsive CopG/Arc/MetJ family transcriptional regulator